jgi:hypothetical protein
MDSEMEDVIEPMDGSFLDLDISRSEMCVATFKVLGYDQFPRVGEYLYDVHFPVRFITCFRSKFKVIQIK